jgi:hypothetical protein
MSDLTDEQIAALVQGLEARFAEVSGWEFSYEYPGIFTFSKDDLVFACTPDWDTEGSICIQVTTTDGVNLDGWDVAYSNSNGLAPEKFVELVEPYLLKAEKLDRPTGNQETKP